MITRSLEDGIYCGRPTALGNPFGGQQPLTRPDGTLCQTKAERIDAFRAWAQSAIEGSNLDDRKRAFVRTFNSLLERLRAGEELKLRCWCSPLEDCHVDVIITMLRDRLCPDRNKL